MLNQMSLLKLVGLATAASIPRQSPTLSSSKGFNLILQLNDPATDFDPPVQNSFITSIHTGAGLALVGISPDQGRVFYQNGTQEELLSGQSTVITDSGTPPFPSGLKLTDDGTDITTANLDAGPGTRGLSLSDGDGTHLMPGTFFACKEALDYYGGKEFVIIKQSNEEAVPAQCRAAKLVPQCTELNELPEGSTSSHEFALDSPCHNQA